MAYSFGSWADEIAAISTRPEFQNAQVRITFVTAPGEYNIETGKTEGRVIDTLYSGQARIIAVRSAIFNQASAMMNSHVSETVRVQIPKNATGRILTGATVYIESASDNPSLVGRSLKVNSDFQGARSAARTLECGYDNDQATGLGADDG